MAANAGQQFVLAGGQSVRAMMEEEFEKEVAAVASRTYFWWAVGGIGLVLLGFLMGLLFFTLKDRTSSNQQLLEEIMTTQAIQETAVALNTPTPVLITATAAPGITQPSQEPILITVVAPPTDTPTPIAKPAFDVGERESAPEPALQSDNYAVDEDTNLTMLPQHGLLANDSHVRTVEEVTQPVHGTVTANSDGSFSYLPNPDFYGEDFFTYEACSAAGSCAVASVFLTVRPINDPPVAEDDRLTVAEDDEMRDITTLLLANDLDEENNRVSIANVETSNPERVLFSANLGTVAYDPGDAFISLAVGETAVDSFQYGLTDGRDISNTATVTITIQGKNGPPIAQNDAFTVNANAVSNALTSNMLSNDSDPDTADKPLLKIHTISNNAAGGSASLLNGTVTYNPGGAYDFLAADETAVDTFAYTIIDPAGAVSSPATVEMTIRGVNEPPALTVSNLTNPVVFSSTLTSVANIATQVSLSDVDNETMSAMVIRFGGSSPRPDGQAEYVQLTFQNQIITSTSNIISLSSAPLPISTYVAALQTAQYVNNRSTPTAGCRLIEFQVFDADSGASLVRAVTVQVDNFVCPPQPETAVSQPIAALPRRTVW